MVTKSLKVDIFEVEEAGSPMSVAIRRAIGASREDRVREANRKERRLEHHRNDGGYILLNFVTFNFPGPGRVEASQPAVPIGLGAGQYFSQETAMLYDDEMGLVFLEAGRGGMGPGAVANYFQGFARDANYVLVPRLDEAASAKARRKRLLRKIRMRVSLAPISAADEHESLSALRAFSEPVNGGFIDVLISAGPARRRTLSLDGAWKLVSEALAAYAEDEGSILKLTLEGRDHEDESPELIDLLQHRERRTRELNVDPVRRWVDYNVRWDALAQIRGDCLRDAVVA